MNTVTVICIALPSTLSLFTSIIYAYIAFKKSIAPPKDEVWETATKIICSGNFPISSADDFANIYEELKLFKDNGCSMKNIATLSHAVMKKRKQEQSIQSEIN